MLPISGISLFVQYTVMLHRVRRVNEATRGRRERTYSGPKGPNVRALCATAAPAAPARPPPTRQASSPRNEPNGHTGKLLAKLLAIPAEPAFRPELFSMFTQEHVRSVTPPPAHRHSERLECRRARSRAPHHRRRMARSETRTTAQISRSSRAAGQAIQKGGAEEGRDESQWRVADDVSS